MIHYPDALLFSTSDRTLWVYITRHRHFRFLYVGSAQELTGSEVDLTARSGNHVSYYTGTYVLEAFLDLHQGRLRRLQPTDTPAAESEYVLVQHDPRECELEELRTEGRAMIKREPPELDGTE